MNFKDMKYKSGDEYKDDDATYKTYGITEDDHINKIEIHGDEKLRNKILDFLNSSQQDNILMLCGHPKSAIISSDEGTHYCGMCEDETKRSC